jgi:pentatricopeptide repeat protein
MVALAYVQKGQFRDALSEIEHWRQIDGDNPWDWAMEAVVYARSGRPAEARRAFRKMEEANRYPRFDLTLVLLNIYAAMGDKNKVISLLRKQMSQHSNATLDLKVNPLYDPLRSDPRFQQILRHLHLN